MGSIKFNTAVIHTIHGEVLDVLAGTDSVLLSQLKDSKYYDEMLEEANAEKLSIEAYSVQSLAHFYETHKHNNSLEVRVSYFPNKVVFHR